LPDVCAPLSALTGVLVESSATVSPRWQPASKKTAATTDKIKGLFISIVLG
jgi:hypothetical protein